MGTTSRITQEGQLFSDLMLEYCSQNTNLEYLDEKKGTKSSKANDDDVWETSIWEPVFFHHTPWRYQFDDSDPFMEGFCKQPEASGNGDIFLSVGRSISENEATIPRLFFNFNPCNDLTSCEFLLIEHNGNYSSGGGGGGVRGSSSSHAYDFIRYWVQNKSPLQATANEVTASNIQLLYSSYGEDDQFGGLYKVNNSDTFLTTNVFNDWQANIGSKTTYTDEYTGYTGVKGFSGIIGDGYISLFVRVDNQNKNNAKIYKSNMIIGGNLYEY